MHNKKCPKHSGYNAWQGRLRGCGYRITASREAILDVLLKEQGKHLAAEDIYLAVHKSYPAIGLTTVYRTLELLVEMNLVVKLDFGDGKARYEMRNDEEDDNFHSHHHLFCNSCKEIIDCDDLTQEERKQIEKLRNRLAEENSFDIDGYLIQFHGTCESCRDNQNEGR